MTPALFKIADTPEKMAKLNVNIIQKAIQQIGLAPTKAKNLKKMALQIIESDGLHDDWNYLESLAGVGHKTASVVMSQWYNHPAFPVDTHIHRCAQRWGLSSGKNVKTTENDLKKLFPSFDELFFKSTIPLLSFDKPNSYSEQSIPLDSTPLILAIFNLNFVLGIVAPGGA